MGPFRGRGRAIRRAIGGGAVRARSRRRNGHFEHAAAQRLEREPNILEVHRLRIAQLSESCLDLAVDAEVHVLQVVRVLDARRLEGHGEARRVPGLDALEPLLERTLRLHGAHAMLHISLAAASRVVGQLAHGELVDPALLRARRHDVGGRGLTALGAVGHRGQPAEHLHRRVSRGGVFLEKASTCMSSQVKSREPIKMDPFPQTQEEPSAPSFGYGRVFRAKAPSRAHRKNDATFLLGRKPWDLAFLPAGPNGSRRLWSHIRRG